MKRLEINTKESVYEPIEITINGKLYTAVELTYDVMEAMEIQEELIRKGKATAAYEQIKLVFGNHPEFRKLTLQHVNDIIAYITEKIYQPERIRAGATAPEKKAKNGKGPGSKK